MLAHLVLAQLLLAEMKEPGITPDTVDAVGPPIDKQRAFREKYTRHATRNNMRRATTFNAKSKPSAGCIDAKKNISLDLS